MYGALVIRLGVLCVNRAHHHHLLLSGLRSACLCVCECVCVCVSVCEWLWRSTRTEALLCLKLKFRSDQLLVLQPINPVASFVSPSQRRAWTTHQQESETHPTTTTTSNCYKTNKQKCLPLRFWHWTDVVVGDCLVESSRNTPQDRSETKTQPSPKTVTPSLAR